MKTGFPLTNMCSKYFGIAVLALTSCSPVFSQNWWTQPDLGGWSGPVIPLNSNQSTALNPVDDSSLALYQSAPVDSGAAPDPNWDLNHQGIYLKSIDFLCYLTGLPTNDPWSHVGVYKRLAERWFDMLKRNWVHPQRGGAYEIMFWYDYMPHPLQGKYTNHAKVCTSDGLLLADVYALSACEREYRLDELTKFFKRPIIITETTETDAAQSAARAENMTTNGNNSGKAAGNSFGKGRAKQ